MREPVQDSERPAERSLPPVARVDRATALALQRAHGNRRVARWARSLSRKRSVESATERTTGSNMRLAEEVDAMRALDDAALRKRREEIQKALAGRAVGDERVRLVRTQDAIDFVAAERDRHARVPRPQPTSDDTVYRRLVAERSVQLHNSVERGLERLGATEKRDPEYRRQADQIRAEAAAFATEFKRQARLNADRILDGSARTILQVLRDYGLPTRPGAWTEDSDKFKRQADEWMEVTHKVDDYRAAYEAPAAAKHRKRLAQWVAHLQKLQIKVAEREQELEGEPGAGAGSRAPKDPAERDAARKDLATAWIQAERHHPILTAYRRDGALESIKLGAIAAENDDSMRALLLRTMPTVANILEAKRWLMQGKVDPLSLGPVVALTRSHMFVPAGSVRAAALNDLVADAGNGGWVLPVITAALSLVLLLPTGGASLALPGLLALDVYSGLKSYVQYDLNKQLRDTDLDRARSLSNAEPSLTGLALTLVSVGLSGASLIGAFRQAQAIRRLTLGGDDAGDAVKALNELGRQHGAGDLGDDVLKAVRREEAAASSVTKPPPIPPKKAPPGLVKPPPKKPWTPPIPIKVRTLRLKTAEEVKAAVISELSPLGQGMHPSKLPTDWMSVLDALARNPGPVNDKLRKLLPTVMGGLRDPKLWAEVLAEAFEIARRADSSINPALLTMAVKSGHNVKVIPRGQGLLDPPEFFKQYASQPLPFVDMPLIGDAHGGMTHIVQDLVVDRALKYAKANMTSNEFRALLAGAEGSYVPGPLAPIFPSLRGTSLQTGDYVWQMTYDLYQSEQLPKPEAVGGLLRKLLGLN